MRDPKQPDLYVTSIVKPVPILSVRFVYPVTDPATGEKRDMIINKLVRDRKGPGGWHRMIPGLGLRIPWPAPRPDNYKEHPDDTIRIDVDTRTFVPTLLRPPMPSSVIDELRNKFSIFRTRHDPEYVARKMEEDRLAEMRKKLVKDVRTPLHDMRLREKELKRKKGKGKLPDDMLEKLGRVISERKMGLTHSADQEQPSAPQLNV